MASSSFVGIATTGILEAFVERTATTPWAFLFAALSSLMPSAPRRLMMRSRTSVEFSPMPPVMMIASAPPITVL